MQGIKKIIKESWPYSLYIKSTEKIRNKRRSRELRALRGSVLDQYIPKGKIGAELGVLKGILSTILVDITKPKELHLMDPWYFLEANWGWCDGNQSTIDALRTLLKSNKKNIEEGKVFVHVQDDLKTLNLFPDDYFDWIYVDSSHEYNHTVAELKLIEKKIKSTGIICGDDWRPDVNHYHHGVFKAVNEFCAEYNYEVIYANDKNLQWVIQRSGTTK